MQSYQKNNTNKNTGEKLSAIFGIKLTKLAAMGIDDTVTVNPFTSKSKFPLLELHSIRRLALCLLFLNVFPVGTQNRATGFLLQI